MSDMGSKRVLIVEDEPLVAMLLEDMLTDIGIEVVGPALRFARAMELAEAERLDGAILDVNLGNCRSDAIAEVLHARGIPFLYATGYESAGDQGIAGIPVIRKPFKQAQLQTALEALLETTSET